MFSVLSCFSRDFQIIDKLGQRKSQTQISSAFGAQKDFVKKKFWVHKSVSTKTILVSKTFGYKKFWFKKIFGPNIFWVHN